MGRAAEEVSDGANKAQTVRRLWALCAILRDEGVTYHEYLTELTYVLFLKLASELGIEEAIPKKYRWESLLARRDSEPLAVYQELLHGLAASRDRHVRSIFSGSNTRIRSNDGFARLLTAIDDVEWSSMTRGEIGDVYEGLIEKSAQEARYGAGQYFTPRPLVEAITAAMKPDPADVVYDPAAGTAGFLIAAGLAARTSSAAAQPRLFGVELSHDVHRLGLANLYLHDLEATYLTGDALSGSHPPRACSLCMTNPPFGIKGTVPQVDAEALTFPTSNKQLAFLQHVYMRLDQEGRAAVIVPDNVLFERGTAALVRAHLMDAFDVHTVLRLPPGIFYATGVRTSVLFFAATSESHQGTRRVWFYDLRSRDRRPQLTRSDLNAFVRAYGKDPRGRSRRRQSDRFSAVAREELAQHDDRLDVSTVETSSASRTREEATAIAQLEVLQQELTTAETALKALIELVHTTEEPAHPAVPD